MHLVLDNMLCHAVCEVCHDPIGTLGCGFTRHGVRERNHEREVNSAGRCKMSSVKKTLRRSPMRSALWVVVALFLASGLTTLGLWASGVFRGAVQAATVREY